MADIVMVGKHAKKAPYHGWYHTREMLLCDERGRRNQGGVFFLQMRCLGPACNAEVRVPLSVVTEAANDAFPIPAKDAFA